MTDHNLRITVLRGCRVYREGQADDNLGDFVFIRANPNVEGELRGMYSERGMTVLANIYIALYHQLPWWLR